MFTSYRSFFGNKKRLYRGVQADSVEVMFNLQQLVYYS